MPRESPASKSPCGFRESKLNSFGSFRFLAHPCQGMGLTWDGFIRLGGSAIHEVLVHFWNRGCLAVPDPSPIRAKGWVLYRSEIPW